MKTNITDEVTVIVGKGGYVYVTRPCIFGGISVHGIKDVNPDKVICFLTARAMGEKTGMIQDVFPELNDEDREFLKTGITPTQWNQLFPPQKEE